MNKSFSFVLICVCVFNWVHKFLFVTKVMVLAFKQMTMHIKGVCRETNHENPEGFPSCHGQYDNIIYTRMLRKMGLQRIAKTLLV